ncbi:hypothetical protein D3C78_860610 [compost metagenome]
MKPKQSIDRSKQEGYYTSGFSLNLYQFKKLSYHHNVFIILNYFFPKKKISYFLNIYYFKCH